MEDYFASGPMSGSTDELFAAFSTPESPYQLEEVVGTGRMSWVLRARETAGGAPVALKVLRPSMARESEILRRFFTEAQVLGRIDHPAVVRMLGHGTHAGFPYTALELVDGCSLDARLLKHGPVSWGEALVCLTDLAQGLAAAHALGIIHRDLKPSNAMVTRAGRGKLADFGLVQVEGAARITRRVRTIGTPLYTAPEVLQGGPFDVRADLYGLGAVGSAMLRGKPPYEARDFFELLERHRSEDRGFPADYPGAVPRALIAILDGLLDLDPAVRPTGASAVVLLLNAVPRPLEGQR